MKTLKKALCLVLALVMVVGTMAVSAFAAADNTAAYTDAAAAKASDYADAINVCVGLGIIKGVSDTELALDGTLTRDQAAKIAAYLMLGSDLAESLPASGTAFSDVKATDWASKFIAYIASEGIINGYAGKFDPAGTLTGYQFAKILLNSLGYGLSTDKDGNTVNAYTGNYWATKVAQDAAKIDLFKGIKADLTAGLTRGAAMQMVYNALKKNLTLSESAYNAQYKWSTSTSEDGTVTILKVGKDTIAEMAAEPSYTKTVAAKETDLNKVLGLKDDAVVTVAAAAKYYVNGELTAPFAGYEKGDEIEVFASNKTVSTVKVTRYQLVKVADVKALTDAQIKALAKADEGAKNTITLTKVDDTNYTVYDVHFAGTATKDAYLLAAVTTDGKKVVASKAATTVAGKVAAIKNSQFNLNGTHYDASIPLAIGDEGTWALDQAGIITKVVTVTVSEYKSSDYALVYRVVTSAGSTTTGNDGFSSTGAKSYTVYAVLADGSKASFAANYKDGKIGGITVAPDFDTKSTYDMSVVTAYEIKDGKFVAATAADDFTATGVDFDKVAKVADGVYANANTKFVFVSYLAADGKTPATKATASSVKVDVVTGYSKAGAAAANVKGIFSAKKTAKVVFVEAANAASSSTVVTPATYAVVIDNVPVETKENGSSVFTYDITGENGEKTFTFSSNVTLTKGSVVTYTTTNGKATLGTPVTSGEVLFCDGQLVVKYGEAEVTYNVDNAAVKEVKNDNGTISVVDGTLKIGAKVVVKADSNNNASLVYIVG